jgi:hypothetical protein
MASAQLRTWQEACLKTGDESLRMNVGYVIDMERGLTAFASCAFSEGYTGAED